MNDPYANRAKHVDIHSYLANEARRHVDQGQDFRIPAGSNATTANRGGSSGTGNQVGFDDILLQLDSYFSEPSSNTSAGELTWIIPPINNTRDIVSCVAISITEIRFPRVFADNPSLDNITPAVQAYPKVYVQIVNAPFTQAILGYGGVQYHFECDILDTVPASQQVRLVPSRPTYFFRRPITTLSEIKLRFLLPPYAAASLYKPISLPKYVTKVGIILQAPGGPGFNPLRLILSQGQGSSIIVGEIGALAPSTRVFITGMQSGSGALDQQINNPNGILITNVLGVNFFEVAGINSMPATQQGDATMYITKNRLVFPMRFTTAADGPTNYIGVTHD